MADAQHRPQVVIHGVGGHGKVVADAILAAAELELCGFIDDRLAEGEQGAHFGDWPVFPVGWLLSQPDCGVALGLGDNRLRARWGREHRAEGRELVAVVHPRACVADSARLGVGVFVAACAVVGPAATVGEGAIINTHAVVEHDVRVGAYAHVCPQAVLGGAATLGDASLLGTSATVLPGVNVAGDVTVGAGAVVTRDLARGCTAVGVPARPRETGAQDREPG